MKQEEQKAVRCPYRAGEVPAELGELCAGCAVARKSEPGGRASGKHLPCSYKAARAERKQPQKRDRRKPPKSKPHDTEKRRAGHKTETAPPKPKEGDYDGYYDDVPPLDDGGGGQGIDQAVAKKVILLIAGVLVIVGLCVAVLYLL